MKKFILTGTLSLLFLAGAAQYCGGGLYKLSLFTENGEAKKVFTYEFFPAPTKLVEQYKALDRQGDEVALREWEEKALNTTDTSDIAQMLATLKEHKTQRRGTITPELRFITYEGMHNVMLLRISDGKYSHYILGNFLGGCDYELKIIWLGKEEIALRGSRGIRPR